MRWLAATGVGGVLFFGCGLNTVSGTATASRNADLAASPVEASAPIIDEIVFVGLRRIAPAAARAQISSRPGTALDLRQIRSDVRMLGRLGWFGEISVGTKPVVYLHLPTGKREPHVLLIFHVEELPWLVKVEYTGSRLLSTGQIEKMLREKQLDPRLGEPADDFRVKRVAKAIESSLAELGHPESSVRVLREEYPNGTIQVRYEINDGPHIPVGRIDFEGDPEVSPRLLKREMRRTAPGLLTFWSGKGAFTREGFEEDRSKILLYYRDHGFPEARIGDAQTSVFETAPRWWMPRPFCKREKRLALSVPIEAGPTYRIKSVDVSSTMIQAGGKRGEKLLAYTRAQEGTLYSGKTMEDLRHAWVVASQPRHASAAAPERGEVKVSQTMDPDTNEVRAQIGFSDQPAYIVRRIEFHGQHRFSDRYLRRRIGLQEGQPFDERGLENGLARLAKTGYFHQIHKQNIHIDRNDATHTADVVIYVSEAGQQRTSFSGGRGQFGNTLGIAYSLFDMLQREELLSAQLDAGPDSLQLALGLMMEGFLGSRSSLAISLFNNVLRPRFASSVKGPFYTSQSEGMNAAWSYALTQTDTFSIDYAFTRSNTDYSISLPPSLAGLPSPGLRAETSSSTFGLGWARDTASERISVANSVSGSVLGGSENVLRSNEEYARIYPDRLFNRENSWAFRTTFSGAGSYQGDMPFYARLFSGDSQVRGVNSGELGPYAVIPITSADGAPTYSALPTGANLITATNAEYRIPLRGGAQGAGFFDLGSGLLLPNWLGKTRPTLLDSTNGVLHGSLGFELRWTVPEIQLPVRAYYAVNVLRLNRFLQLPDGSLFHAHNKLLSFGWALGNLF